MDNPVSTSPDTSDTESQHRGAAAAPVFGDLPGVFAAAGPKDAPVAAAAAAAVGDAAVAVAVAAAAEVDDCLIGRKQERVKDVCSHRRVVLEPSWSPSSSLSALDMVETNAHSSALVVVVGASLRGNQNRHCHQP